MMIKTSKIFMLLLSSILTLVGVKTIIACGNSDEPEETTSIFAPEIIEQPSKIPFFLSPHIYYESQNPETEDSSQSLTYRNSAEWGSFFENKISPEDVDWLIYGSTITDLETLKKGIANRKLHIDTLNKAVVSLLRKQPNNKDILDYIILAKSVEKYFNAEYSSWQPVAYDSIALQPVIKVCTERFTSATVPFLKQRYGFQVTRALSVSGRYSDCIRFYDEVFMPAATAGGMFYRSLGYKARSLYRLEQFSLSNYFYAFLYRADPCQRYQALQGFHPLSEEDWKATLRLAKDTEDQQSLWELFGIYADPATAIKELYKIDPQSKSLPLLLVRSVNIIEEQKIQNPSRDFSGFYYDDYTEHPASEAYDYGNLSMDSLSCLLLIATIEKAIAEKKTDNLAVWQLSGAYLLLLEGNYAASEAILTAVSSKEKDSLLLGQAAIIKGLLAVKEMRSVDAAAEQEIFDNLKKIAAFNHPALRKENALRFITSQLSLVYARQKDSLKKELAYPLGQGYYQSSRHAGEMISFMQRNDHDSLENLLLRQYPLNLKNLRYIKGVAYLYEYNFPAAAQELEKVDSADMGTLSANPFTIHINDCHDCDNATTTGPAYTAFSFAKKMAELKAKGDSSHVIESRAQNYFLLANGMYNMTWYGNSSSVHNSNATRDDYNSVVYHKNPDLRASNFFKCRDALANYQKAFALSRNKEFRAKCTWMSAKCEHNLWLDDRNEDSRLDFNSGKSFRLMKSDFSNTQYYREVIKECGYFCNYITGKDSCKRNRYNY